MKKNKVPVKVSNGEHIFTPNERLILEAQGVDLNLLAPNAKNGFSLKNGGIVPKGYVKGGEVSDQIPADEMEELIKDINSKKSKEIIKKRNISDDDLKILIPESDIYKGGNSAPGPANIYSGGVGSKESVSPLLSNKKDINIYSGGEGGGGTTVQVDDIGKGIPYSGGITPAPKEKKENPVDLGLIASIGQVGSGLLQTIGEKRPIDTIDPDYAKAIADAQVSARTGLTPEERAIAERDIEYNRRSGIDSSANVSGGSTAVAMGNIRQSNNEANDASLKLASLDSRLKMQNKQYATGLLAELDARKRKIFDDSLMAFKENESAGAELLGAGIDNLIKRQQNKRLKESLAKVDAAGKVDLSSLFTT